VSVEAGHSRPLPVARTRLVWLLAVGAVGVSLLAAGVLLAVATPPSGAVSARPSEPPVLGVVPDFTSQRQDGVPWGRKDLEGSIWVANFIFTRCPKICPTLTAKMAGLQLLSGRRLPQLKLVSFTIDPEHDTPQALASYGTKYGADFARWSFLRADRSVLEGSLTKGLFQTLEMGDGADLNTISHSSYLVLIDRQSRMRGFYRLSEPSTMELVMRDAEALARAP
jgi:protein SCO1/2